MSEKVINSDDTEYVFWLKQIANEGPNVLLHSPFRNTEFEPKEYQNILDAIVLVYKIGGNLDDGIKRLKEDYQDNINAYNLKGWGKKSVGRTRTSVGEKRAILKLVNEERQNYKNKEKTCEGLGIEFDTYKKYHASINKVDKQHKEELQNKGFSDEKISEELQNIEKSELNLYMSELENKAFSGVPDYKHFDFGDIYDPNEGTKAIDKYMEYLGLKDEIAKDVLTPLEFRLKNHISKIMKSNWEIEMLKFLKNKLIGN